MGHQEETIRRGFSLFNSRHTTNVKIKPSKMNDGSGKFGYVGIIRVYVRLLLLRSQGQRLFKVCIMP